MIHMQVYKYEYFQIYEYEEKESHGDASPCDDNDGDEGDKHTMMRMVVVVVICCEDASVAAGGAARIVLEC